ncbi:MAG: hypothetical protein PWQ57_3452 [Desulfovibrionales bacterium]|nr:hypothetical protein [Desulfovibrionales bacterium]
MATMYVTGIEPPPSSATSLDEDTMGVTRISDRFDFSTSQDLPNDPPQSLEEGLGTVVNTRA